MTGREGRRDMKRKEKKRVCVCVCPLESQGSFWTRDVFTFFLLQQGAAVAAVRAREREGGTCRSGFALRELDRTS